MKGYLALEDGTILEGVAFGAAGSNYGEVVFNTGMTGYQEVLTDPSYCYQIVIMTYPLIGNYGMNWEEEESSCPHVKGFVVREFCTSPNHWRSIASLEEYLIRHHIIGLAGVDTRFLTRHLRDKGTMKGIIASGDCNPDELVQQAKDAPGLSDSDLVREVTPRSRYVIPGNGHRLALMDFGAKENIMRVLRSMDCEVYVFPADATAEQIAAVKPEGIILSNGPGDPANVPYAIETAKKLIGSYPMFGICLGHQVLAMAMGAKVFKLKFGHRGANHPVCDVRTGRIYITSQNHGFAIDRDSLQGLDIEVTHINANDKTIEGIKHKEYPVFSVQYHPEAAPGPHDSSYLFADFLQTIEG